MLEILIVYFLCKTVGDILRKKNRPPLPFQIMTGVLWVGGELAGGFCWGVFQVLNGGAPKEVDFTVYLWCLIGAGLGAGFSFLVAFLVPSAQPSQPPYGYAQGPNYSQPPNSGNPYNPYDPSTPPQSQPPRNPFSDR